jgi:acetyl-CoA carboxylase biotin carboxyl carrier protein
MELDDIQKIMALMDEHGLTEFELVKDGTRLSLRRGGSVVALAPAAAQPSPPPVAAPAPVQAPVVAAAPAPSAPADKCVAVKAPFVGTFYRSSAPDADPYVAVGQEVSPDTVLCIVEAMKVMNEIKAEVRGVVREILVENAQPVQFGQTLFRIEPL